MADNKECSLASSLYKYQRMYETEYASFALIFQKL